jgi:hypothetical protein
MFRQTMALVCTVPFAFVAIPTVHADPPPCAAFLPGGADPNTSAYNACMNTIRQGCAQTHNAAICAQAGEAPPAAPPAAPSQSVPNPTEPYPHCGNYLLNPGYVCVTTVPGVPYPSKLPDPPDQNCGVVYDCHRTTSPNP